MPMAPMSRGKPKASQIVKPTVRRKKTESHRAHRYESFNTRITKLKITPLRSGARPDLDTTSDDLTSAASSYFATSLAEWNDRNLSSTFTDFADAVAPYVESLPMVLHHADRITSLLLEHIQKGDKYSLEPLCALLGSLAHDLDYRFEEHFQIAFATTADVAARVQEPECIEWAFGALAFLVKYMSRVLLQEGELSGTWWTSVSKWLGKEKQRPFVVRFMGEVVGFLLRRAAKDTVRTKRILGTLLAEFLAAEENALLGEGLKVAFSEAVKGVALGTHSSGIGVLVQLVEYLQSVEHEACDKIWEMIMRGTIISIIHHTDPDGFRPVQDGFLDCLDGLPSGSRSVLLATRIIGLISTTRKGARITDWPRVIKAALRLVDQMDACKDEALPGMYREVAETVVLVFQTAPRFVSESHKSIFMRFTSDPWAATFVPLCFATEELSPESFSAFLTKPITKADKLGTQAEEVALLQARLHQKQVDMSLAGQEAELERLLNIADHGCMSDRDAYLLSAIAPVLHQLDPRHKTSYAERLWSLLCRYTHGNEALGSFLVGKGFEMASSYVDMNAQRLQAIVENISARGAHVAYWKGLVHLCRQDQHSLLVESANQILDAAIERLRSASREMRLVAIDALCAAYEAQREQVPEICSHIRSIEEAEPSVQTARLISTQIRKIAIIYRNLPEKSRERRTAIAYLFGIMHISLSQAWTDAAEVLAEISTDAEAEELITSIIVNWLGGGAEDDAHAKLDWSPISAKPAVSDFECAHVNIVSATLENARLVFENPEERLKQLFFEENRPIPAQHPFNRTQALRVLRAIPRLAEKKSRVLTPVLLEWVDKDIAEATPENGQRWNRKDQKAMLDVFAQFQNPRVLYLSSEVYQALLRLLMNGDLEIQKSAIKALLAWKEPEVVRYEQHLNNLLDDARFREEISIFLRADDEEGIRSQDLPVLSPMLLRLLYGILVNRSGNASGIRGKQTKRKAVFIALARFSDDVLGEFIKIALEPVGSSVDMSRSSRKSLQVAPVAAHPRRQLGMLNMIHDMADTLGNRLDPFSSELADAALLCLIAANTASGVEHSAEDQVSEISLLKNIRQASFKCLEQLMRSCTAPSWREHAEAIVKYILVPRLDNFAAEFAQSISGIFRLISVWTLNSSTATFLVDFAPRLLEELARCLVSDHSKGEVKQYILDEILAQLLVHVVPPKNDGMMEIDDDNSSAEVVGNVLRPYASLWLDTISALLHKSPSKELLDSGVSCVSRLAVLIDGKEEAARFIEIATFLLRQPAAKVTIATKRKLLLAIQRLIPTADLQEDDDVSSSIYEAMSPLFAYLRDREGRETLCAALHTLVPSVNGLSQVAGLVADLNSWAPGRIEEPDFERRAGAFNTISDSLYQQLNETQWRLIIHNMLFYIQDNDEVAIRASASYALRRFISIAVQDDRFTSPAFEGLMTTILYPGIQNGMRSSSEFVRSEYLTVLGEMVTKMPFWSQTSDLVALLANGDEEASFFSNVLHVQQHRRLRALRRLAGEADKAVLSAGNVSLIFWPLLEHFIFDAAADDSAHNLTAETVTTLSSLASCLEWSQYRAILRKYIAGIKNMEGKEKTTIRLVGSIIDTLHRARPTITEAEDGTTIESLPAQSNLARTLPKQDNFVKAVVDHYLPPLTEFLHLKDESTVSLRVPVGVAIVKLLKCLPDEVMVAKLAPVLLDLSHILRSRDQGSRDMTRKTMAEVTALLGPHYFQFIVKQLRSALQRGYQLHVLSFTIHSILVENLGKLKCGDLDHCIPDLTAVIMDDIFGVAGQEKDAEEYISKMKEVKSSKSFDSMELLAKITNLDHLSLLIRPVQALLREKLDLRTVKKIDELLRRLALGVTQNPALVDQSILVFCYEIIKLSEQAKPAPVRQNGRTNDYKTQRYLIQMQAAHKSGKKGMTSSYSFKLVRFAVDLLRSVLQKHDELKTPSNLSGFVPIISEALVAGQEEVQLSVMRLLTGIMRVPLPELERNSSVYVAEAVKIIKAAPAMTTESAQAALKLMSAALRDRSSSKIRETDLAYTLKRLKPDLEEPDRQGVIFNFLKAVLGRKIVITEVYEIMDSIASIMVTNQSKQARDLARGIYFQFVMDYPQAMERLNKQVAFLVKNLSYAYPEGRKSVLDVLHLLLQRTKGDIGQKISSTVFVPLVMVLANDDSPECREAAGSSVKLILANSDDEVRQTYTTLLQQWLGQDNQILLRRISLQIWKMMLEAHDASVKDANMLLRSIDQSLPNGEEAIARTDWELLYYALQLFAQIVQAKPDLALSTKCNSLWNGVFRCLTFPHAWIKLSAARLVGLLFSDIGRTNKDMGLRSLPLATSGTLPFSSADAMQLCQSSIHVLRHEGSSDALLTQTSRNLVFLGRVFAAADLIWSSKPTLPTSAPSDIDSDAASDDEQPSQPDNTPPSALSHLLLRLSQLISRNTSSTNPSTLPPKLSALNLVSTLVPHLTTPSPHPSLLSSLPRMLHPLLLLTDPSIPRPTSQNTEFTTLSAALGTAATELQGALRGALGTKVFVDGVGQAQARLREVRDERRAKRRIERVAEPERYERRKERKVEGGKRRRREKGAEFAGRRRGW